MTAMVQRRAVPAMLAVMAGTLAAMAARQRMLRTPALPPPPPPQWVTISEAARYSGLSEGFLSRLVAAKKLTVMSDSVPKIRRADLDRLGDLGSAVGQLRQAMRGRRG